MEFFKTAIDKKIDRQLTELQARLSSEVSAFTQNKKDDLDKRFSIANKSIEEFGHLYTPHYFDLPSAPYHSDLDAMFNYPVKHLFCVHGPREHGKSARLRVAKLRALLTGQKHYILKVSESLKLAKKDLAFIQLELIKNERIASDFKIGFLKADEDKLWFSVTPKATGQTHYAAIEAYSYGSSMRGAMFMKYRPDLADIDDFENKKSVRNPEISREKLDWVLSELYLGVSNIAPIIWVGNNIAKTSALNMAFEKECTNFKFDKKTGKRKIGQPDKPAVWERHEKTGHRYQALVKKGRKRIALWPAKMNVAALDKLLKNIGTSRFEGEMQGNPVEEGLRFKHEWFSTYDGLPKLKRITGWIDQSLGETKNNDFKAIVIAGTDGLNYYVLGAWLRQATMRAMVDAAYSLYIMFRPLGLTHFKIEDNFGQYSRISYRDFVDGAKRHGFPLPISPAQNTLKKEMRIETLEPLMESKRVLWPIAPDSDIETLKDQLLGFPSHPFDDGPDALSGVIDNLRVLAIESGTGYKAVSKRRYGRARK